MPLQSRRSQQEWRRMAGSVEILPSEHATVNKPAFHALNPHPGGTDMATRAAKIAAFRREAIISWKSHDTGSQEFRSIL
jgi:hypothetical protein